MIYKVLPNVEIAWEDVWIAAAITALLFEIGKVLIGLYVGKSSVASSFGAAGPFVVLMLWIYYSTQIFLKQSNSRPSSGLVAIGKLTRRRITAKLTD